MSFAEDNIKTGSETVNVEDILANFFLEKFDMKGSDRSESDSKYKKKSKHKKHKSKKHKHKSGRRSDSSERRNSNSMSIGCTSSSEEKDIKRLKKIKSLDVKDPNKINSFLPVSLSTQNAIPSNQNNASASTKNPLPYGPSLELLLTGTEIIEGNFESKKQSISSLDRSSEPSSHQVSSVPASADLKPSSESVSTSKELIENTSKKMECGEEKVTNNVEMTSNNVHCTSKELVSDSKLKVSDVDSAVKQELSEGKGKKFKGKSRSRSRTRSKHRKRSRSRSRSKPRKPSRSRSRSKLRKPSRSRSRSKPRKPSRSRSRSNPRKNSRSRSRSKPRKPSRSRSRSKRKHSRSRSRSKPRKPSRSRSRSKSRKHSRSRSRSKPRKRSRSKSRSSQSRSRRRSRSRSIYRSRKERSLSRDRSKSRHSPRHKTRRSRSRNRSLKSRRSRSRSHQRRRRSRSWSYSKDTKSRHSARRRSRSTSRNRRSRSRSKGSHRSQRESNRRRKSSSERESKSKQKSRSKSKEKHSSSKSCKIDQAKIREIAEKNVLNMIQQGTLPEGISLEHFKKKELVSIKAGGKSVQELTDFCAKLSKKENEVTDDVHNAKDVGNVDGENDFIHHPFKLKEQSVIKLNIKNAIQIPIKTHAEKFAETAKLSSQFPVSSGNQHKQKELEWVPVVPEESKSDLKQNEVKSVVPVESVAAPKTVVKESSLPPLPPVPVSSDIPSIPLPPAPPPLPPLPPSVPPLPIPPVPPFQLLSSSVISDVKAPVTNSTPLQSVSYPPLPVSHGLPVPSSHPDQISSAPFTPKTVSASTSQFDFASVFSKKFQAEQKLQGDPNNAEALKAIQEAEAAIQEWVNSCKVPGMFYGSTHVKPLPRDQLGGFKDYRVKKDQFTRAAPVTEGKGMSLLKKMGWNPGEGLGKNKEGSLVPLIIDIKMDKKGLVSEGESGKNNIANAVKELQGKHPVSALMELCSKRKWKPPLYTIIKDAGPPHKKQFLFKVEVNGVDYQPVIPSSNKKIAKADAAIVCLQALKVFPS